MKSKLKSYSSPFGWGHRALDGLFDGDPVYVSEKIDGSQISFGVDTDGELHIRSRKVAIDPESPGMFDLAVASILGIRSRLAWGYTYRGEYLAKPKQNSIQYDCVPDGNIVIYDIGDQRYLLDGAFENEAERTGLEHAPLIAVIEKRPSQEMIDEWMTLPSLLGGEYGVEGVVLKNYDLYGKDDKVLMGKIVREGFAEKNSKNWKTNNPSNRDILSRLTDEYATEARWNKAIQHLAEQNELVGEMKDMPALFREVQDDVLQECEDEIKETLFNHFWGKIRRGLTYGLPEHYRKYLADNQ